MFMTHILGGHMMRIFRAFLTPILVLFVTSACNDNAPVGVVIAAGNADASTETNNTLPEPFVLSLTQPEDLETEASALTLLVQTDSDAGSQLVSAQYDEYADTWIAEVDAQPGSSIEFTLTWSEQVRDHSLKLAQAVQRVSMPDDTNQISPDIAANDYKHTFDADGDGLTNLAETANSTNPFDSSDPAVSAVKIEVNVNLESPVNLADLKNIATVLPNVFMGGKELTLSFRDDDDEHNQPVSDADFENVLRRFNALSKAIENKDTDALDSLATSSQHSDIFKQLMNNNYDEIEVSITDIRLRDIDKSITGTLQIDSLIRPNGDRASLSEKYTSRKITSRRVNGDWTKIEW